MSDDASDAIAAIIIIALLVTGLCYWLASI